MSTSEVIEKFKLFWQYPVITEKTFYEQQKHNVHYLGFPWATVIDKKYNAQIIYKILQPIVAANPQIQYYTCCQHIYFHRLVPLFKALNITMVYACHKTKDMDMLDGVQIKPCPLYAVNVEDESRNQEFLDVDYVECERKYLYSFSGAYQQIYLSRIRQDIFNLPAKDDTLIENTGGWHFNDTVYGKHQTLDLKEVKSTKQIENTQKYNRLLLDSRFSLCPSGSGPNSIRFWESLAVGAIPVLLADTLELPEHELWKDAIVVLKEKDIGLLDSILRGIDGEKERIMRENCLKIYNDFRTDYMCQNPVYTLVSYCCDTWPNIGGVPRYDTQLKMIFPGRVFFKGPQQKTHMLDFLKKCVNPIVITDNHLACDIPNEYKVFLVHHGCALTTAERNPTWDRYWRDLCCNGQKQMLTHRKKETTKIITISEACTYDFTQHFGELYTQFERLHIIHPSEFNESLYKNSFNEKPVILGNWNHLKKGKHLFPTLQNLLSEFEFRELKVMPRINETLSDFNKRKQNAYLNCDIFLQIANSEGFSYATNDAMICGLVPICTNVGAFFGDVSDNCFVKLDWEKCYGDNIDYDYICSNIRKAWEQRHDLSRNARQWYMDNCRFDDWTVKMKQCVREFAQ